MSLHNNDDSWIKKHTSVELDFTMGSHDSFKVFGIGELFMVDMLSKLFEKKSIGLYRDDGPSIFKHYNVNNIFCKSTPFYNFVLQDCRINENIK